MSPKEEKLFENLLRTTEQFLSGKSYRPLPEAALLQRLHLPSQHAMLFHEVLKTLLKEGKIELTKGCYIWKKISSDVVTGILSVHARGFAFLRPENTTQYPEDIFIPKHLTRNAVDGDKVEVLINTEVVSDKGPEGKVISILERGRTHLAGIIKEIEPFGKILAYVPLLGAQQKVLVHPADFDLKVGDRIVMEVIDWGSKETETQCRVSHYIGHISDPSCDIRGAIEEFELRSDFSNGAIQEARSFGKQVSTKEIRNREDLRHLDCFTVDPDTAKDYDDAVNLTRTAEGGYELGVHIADVSHYVRLDSALDEEAHARSNSTYFPGHCVPMLPSELSENLCSLKPKVNRLAASVLMKFDGKGNLLDYRITRSVIRSRKRFTYKEAKQVLDGKKKSAYSETLALMVEFCKHLKARRYERGSLEFAMPELVVLVDANGVPTGTDYIEYDITHQLVEEFMLKANEVVATHITKLGKGLTYRVHDIPSEENMKDFSSLASAFGFNVSETPNPAELQKLFDEALATPYGQYLATSYIRRMRLAVYSPDNIGHYGLALTYYCHFTSPIRRYVDLVVHRILFGEDKDRESLELISDKCSEQERISARAENAVVLLKKLRLISAAYEKDKYRQYEAVVTKVKNFGFTFEILEFMLESFSHVSEIDDDFYTYDEPNMRLRGVHDGRTFVAGDKILVMLKNINLITLESRWALIDTPDEETEKSADSSKKNQKKQTRKHSDKSSSSSTTKEKRSRVKSSGKKRKH